MSRIVWWKTTEHLKKLEKEGKKTMQEHMINEIESAINESIDSGFINEPDPETRNEMVSEIAEYIDFNIEAAPPRLQYVPDYKSLAIDFAKLYGLMND